MQKITTIAATFALALTGVPAAATAATVTRHHDPIAHMAITGHGRHAAQHAPARGHHRARGHRATGPR